MATHENYIEMCLQLATQGEGYVSPNPLVGSVVLDKTGAIVGKGYHMKYGEAHAEVNALNMAGDKAQGGTIYVNLEPCSHFGKTPPCIDRIIKEGLSTMVVGMTDPNPLVAGSGIQKAIDAGIEVVTCVLEDKSKKLNEVFIKTISQKKPFIALKTAQTIDGKIASASGSSKWITSSDAREEVQKLRNKYDAILTGVGTVIADNPSMTCRMPNGRNPVRVILDSQLTTDPNSKIYADDGTKIILFTTNAEKALRYPSHIEIIECSKDHNDKIHLQEAVDILFEKRISSILVECGSTLNGAFLKSGLPDKIYTFIAPKILGDNKGLSSFNGLNPTSINDCKNFKFGDIKILSPDILLELYP